MEDGNAQMTAMQAQFEETITKLREDFTARLRVQEEANETIRKERPLGTSFGGQGDGGGLGQDLPYVPRDIVPKLPVERPPYVYVAWERRFEVLIAYQGLRHTISPDAPEIAVISCIIDAYLFGEALVTEHRRVWGYICEATADAPFEDRLY